MINKKIIKIKIHNYEKFIKYAWTHDINLYNIKKEKDYIICIVSDEDYLLLEQFYDIEILKNYNKKRYLNILKNNVINIIIFIYAIILFLFFSNIIVSVSINLENKDLLNRITNSLEQKGIKRLSLKKNYGNIQNIKNDLMNEYNDEIEWLEIESIGMTYNIKIESRKKQDFNEAASKCHIIAKKSGVITKIIADKGDVLVENNSYVNEGDILISGEIKYNEEIKTDVCAKGLVYAEKWYNVTLDAPTVKEIKKYSGKTRYNLLLEYDNRDYLIFKDRIENYDSNKSLIISLLGKKLYLIKEYEYINEEYEMNEEELDTMIENAIISKLELKLNDDEKILYKNILKKEVNNSRIRVELFVTVEEQISEQITY